MKKFLLMIVLTITAITATFAQDHYVSVHRSHHYVRRSHHRHVDHRNHM